MGFDWFWLVLIGLDWSGIKFVKIKSINELRSKYFDTSRRQHLLVDIG